MIEHSLSSKVLTIGPSPVMKGGIAQVLDTYFAEVIPSPKFIAETVAGSKLKRVGASAFAAFRLAWRLATDRQVRIVHLHTASGVSFRRSSLLAGIARFFGRSTVMHIHGANFRDYAAGNRRKVVSQLSKADCVVALSDSWARFFTDELGIAHTRVVPNIVATPADEPVTSDGLVHALFLGQLGQRKGIYDLLEAVSRKRAYLDGRLMLHIGGNGETDRVQRTIDDLGLSSMVRFHGWVSGDDKTDLLTRCDLYILPSYAEGLPISVLEAMAYGQAVISTPVGGIPEVVDEENGLLVAPGDIDALGDALAQLVGDSRRTAVMGARSRQKAAPHLPGPVAECLSDLYTSILQGKEGAS